MTFILGKFLNGAAATNVVCGLANVRDGRRAFIPVNNLRSVNYGLLSRAFFHKIADIFLHKFDFLRKISEFLRVNFSHIQHLFLLIIDDLLKYFLLLFLFEFLVELGGAEGEAEAGAHGALVQGQIT